MLRWPKNTRFFTNQIPTSPQMLDLKLVKLVAKNSACDHIWSKIHYPILAECVNKIVWNSFLEDSSRSPAMLAYQVLRGARLGDGGEPSE